MSGGDRGRGTVSGGAGVDTRVHLGPAHHTALPEQTASSPLSTQRDPAFLGPVLLAMPVSPGHLCVLSPKQQIKPSVFNADAHRSPCLL